MGDPETLRPQRSRAPVTTEGKTSWVGRDWMRKLLQTTVVEQNRRDYLRREDVDAVSVAAAALVAMGGDGRWVETGECSAAAAAVRGSGGMRLRLPQARSAAVPC